MSYPTCVSLNCISTDLPEVLQCELVQSIHEDLGETNLTLTNDDLSVESVQTFFSFVSNPNTLTHDNMYELLKVWNYLGCGQDMLDSFKSCYINTRSNYNSFLVWKHWPSVTNTILPPTDLREPDYEKLVEMGYTKEQILPYMWKGAAIEYIPNNSFLEQFSIAKDIVDILGRQAFRKDCFIAGGFLTSCLPCTPDVEPHQDVDIFCLNGVHNVLIEALMEHYKCKCFTALNVTTILVQNSSRPIQVIACAEGNYQEVLYNFDMDCCKISYYDGKFTGMVDFHRALVSNSFSITGRVNRTRLSKYTRRGFSIDISKAELYGHDDLSISNNKYYKWTDESDDRLLYLVKILFSEAYEHTVLPLPLPTREWKTAYEGVEEPSCALRRVEQCLPNGAKFVTLDPTKSINYYLTGITGIVAERGKGYGDNKLVFKLSDTTQLDDIRESLLNGPYTSDNIWKAVFGSRKGGKSVETITQTTYIKPSYKVSTKYSWIRMLDGEQHTINMVVKPVCYLVNSMARIIFECVDI